ncbi:unnamed protein product [Miscanthus lutarioriparius]|uniref:PUM-HD domain-containing protein n=1 Tax=Miscanthus lutarioriparius TaxID=422564 RepID=A0A811MRV4_9POAL|nr:unnamed protein product [Miscanthus lutarioriparius]
MRATKAAAAVERTEDKEIDLLLSEIPHVTSPQGRQRGVGVIGDGNGNGVHGASGSDGYTSPMRIGCRRVHCPTDADGYDAQRHGKDAYYDMVLNRRDNGAPLHGGDAGGVGFPAPSPASGPFVGSPVPPPLALGVGVDDQEQQLVANQLRGLRIGDAQTALQRQGPPPVIHTAPTEVPAAHGAYDGYNFAASGSSVRHEHVFLDQAKPVGYVAARPHRFVSDVGLDDFGGFPRALDTSIGGFMYNRVGHGTGIGWGQGLVQPDFAESYLLSSQAGAEFSSSSPVALKRHYAYGGVPVAANGFSRGRNQFDAFGCDNSPSEVGAEFFSSSPAALDFRGGPKRHYAYGGVSVADNGFARGRNQFEAFHCDNSLMFDGKNMNFLERERERRFQRVNSRALELGSSRTLRFDNVVRVKEGSIYHMAKDQNGCRTRVVQRLIETVRSRDQIMLIISALQPNFMLLVNDPNGNHVIQKCLTNFGAEDNKFIFEGAAANCFNMAVHRHGCCVLQRCISNARGVYQANLIVEICARGFELAQDPFGNYVVQYVLELKIPSANAHLASQFEGKYIYLSKQKVSSNVVERCLKFFPDDAKAVIVHELLLLSGSHFEQLLQDPYANYVIYTALLHTKGHLHNALVEAIRPHEDAIRTSPCCFLLDRFFWPVDTQKIKKIRLPSEQADDILAWHYEKNGLYSVKSAYWMARKRLTEEQGGGQSTSENADGRPVWKEFWRIPLPHEILIFVWKIANNGLATQQNKFRRNIVQRDTCEICGMETESLNHALVGRRHACQLRMAMREHWALPDEKQFLNLDQFNFLDFLLKTERDMRERCLMILWLWRSWQVRNDITHEARGLSIEGSVRFLRSYWTELCNIRQNRDMAGRHNAAVCLAAWHAVPGARDPAEVEALSLDLGYAEEFGRIEAAMPNSDGSESGGESDV